MKKSASFTLASAFLMSLFAQDSAGLPPAAKESLVTEKHAKTTYKDPYRWMENSDDPELYRWLAAEKAYTDAQTASPLREQLVKEFTDILSKGDGKGEEPGSLVFDERDEKMFFRHRFRLKRDGPDSAAGFKKTSPSGRYEIKTTPGNTDIRTLQICDNSIGGYLKDVLTVKFCDCVWDADEKSFVYVSGRDGRIMDGATYVIRRHVLGTDQLRDTVLFESDEPMEDLWMMFESGGYLWFCRNRSSKYNIISALELASGQVQTILQTEDGLGYVGYYGNSLVFGSFIEQDMGEIVSFDLDSGVFTTLVPARDAAFDRAVIYGDSIYATYVRDGANELLRYNLETCGSNLIELPEQGGVYVDSMSSGELLFYIDTCVAGATLYGYDPATGKVRVVTPGQKPDFELDAQLVEYDAAEGWKSVIWVVKRKDVGFSPETPVCFYGYGGFRVNIMPFYDPTYLPWLKRGGAVAIVILPGGLEYGEAWHRLGMRHSKKNVFDSFANAAQTLIDKGWTSPEKTVMQGASNGGLLVAATARYYPKLFRAAIPSVGVQDMARFSLFRCGQGWVGEYGDRDEASDFKFLLSISPYNNVKKNMKYPAAIVVTSDHDDRVVPAHSYKFAARLQAALQKQRILLHVAHGTGHNYHGATLEENVRTLSIIWTFVMQELSVGQ